MDSLVWGIKNPCVLRKSEIYLNNLIYIKLNKTKYDIFTMKKKKKFIFLWRELKKWNLLVALHSNSFRLLQRCDSILDILYIFVYFCILNAFRGILYL